MTRPTHFSYPVIPDRFYAGEYPGAKSAAEGQQKVAAMVQAGITAFIDLTVEGELAPYAQWLPAHVVHERHPIRDVSIPSEVSRTVGILASIDRHLSAGRGVYLHCWGGIGRTGVIVGCWLSSRQGLQADAALTRLAELWRACPKSARRPQSPETAEQRGYVLDWHLVEAALSKPSPGVAA